jgi:glycosyltransferase involved in cell wall biosynthesis
VVRVLFVSAVSHLKGGAEQVLLDMLANPHIEFILALPAPGPLDAVAARYNSPVVYFEPHSLLSVRRPLTLASALRAIPDSIRCSARLRRLAREYNCKIIHSNGLKVHVLNALATLFRSGLRSVVHLHDIPYTFLERALWRALGLAADRVVVVSRPCWPSRKLPANVHIIPNGVVEQTSVTEPALSGQTESSVFCLGFVGRFHPHKGLMLLLDWLGGARAAGLMFKVRLRGGPDPDRTTYWTAVQLRLQEMGLHDRVHVDGWRSGDAVYSGLDAIVVPSEYPDPLPRVVLEAGSRGIPVIALPSGGIPSMIVDRKTGFLVSGTAEFVAVLGNLISNPAVRHSVGTAAREHIAAEFSLRRFYERFDALYAGLSGPPQLPRSTAPRSRV